MKSLIVPHFLNAKTKDELQKLILRLQAKRGGAVTVKFIYQELDGSHTAWFLDEAKTPLIPTEVMMKNK